MHSCSSLCSTDSRSMVRLPLLAIDLGFDIAGLPISVWVLLCTRFPIWFEIRNGLSCTLKMYLAQ